MGISCRECRVLLPGYIQRDLTPKQRERVSRHLNTCSECYAAYEEQRVIVRELAINLPRIGSDHAPLDQIRAAVMAEIAQPKPPRRTARLQARYSVAVLVLMVMLLLPWTFRSYAAEPPPTQPRPENATPSATVMVVASATEAANTLTATLQSNYAPISGATDTP
ncbi:MAG TPA: zf-HC2 domain-containing protein [Phototrophicaceae bacterium]|nr:zf-HC2 domain-containing protein [Phototrophicaceae bacterium]